VFTLYYKKVLCVLHKNVKKLCHSLIIDLPEHCLTRNSFPILCCPKAEGSKCRAMNVQGQAVA
jgi:hypothetical protein